ncbi:MAG: Re/Si-specific NAD(P)(+) transhydrogenase subunit alpha [Gammaproteobacteria bacterium]|nr:MAG: Re/Si-specific NAD(P)(+) transhydrogenase subunit alpha [Gammaproteobacteria bacterium]
MALKIMIPKETLEGEKRVAMTPEVATRLVSQGYEVSVEASAGHYARHADEDYVEAGAAIVSDSLKAMGEADIVLKVQAPTIEEVSAMKEGACVVAFMQPYQNHDLVKACADKRLTAFSVELIPRTSRAQAMDALSSQATVAGYKAALMAANMTDRFLPMLTTAAGTIRPATVLVLGAGVAGLQAIATAKRLGAIVEAYDIRKAAGEQIRSLGAKFIELEIDAEAEGGYARELTEEEKAQEKELLNSHIAKADIVITTAQIPGRRAPLLMPTATVELMKPGSVLIDMAAETGGNCELTRAGESYDYNGITIFGPVNLPSTIAVHASEMYSKNLMNFLGLFSQEEGQLKIDWEDDILAGSVVTHEGEVKNQSVAEAMKGGQS